MRGIVNTQNNQPILGILKEPEHKHINIFDKNDELIQIADSYEAVKDIVFFSTSTGRYYLKELFTKQEILRHIGYKGVHIYPYKFEQVYEAVDHFDIFSGKEEPVTNYKFIGSGKLKYTFGLEYETSLGCIPEDQCFLSGLIPLRDGSISGNEYSTVVMSKSRGLNLIKQQLNLLRKYTAYNKECALHIHFGGFPVEPNYIFTLYTLCYWLQEKGEISAFTNKFVFETERYKKNGKSYCRLLPNAAILATFDQFYNYFVGNNFFGDLYQSHPADVEHNRKWQINTRYFWINFINILCYKSPKTIEFRFLRPTYNFTKICTWIMMLNALLQYAEFLTKKYGAVNIVTLTEKIRQKEILAPRFQAMCDEVYQYKQSTYIKERMSELYYVAQMQKNNEDYAGQDTTIEDNIMHSDFITYS